MINKAISLQIKTEVSTWDYRRNDQKAAPRNDCKQRRRQVVLQQITFDLSWQRDV